MRQTGPPANDFVCPTATFLLRSLDLLSTLSKLTIHAATPFPSRKRKASQGPRIPSLDYLYILPDCHIADYSSCLAYALQEASRGLVRLSPLSPFSFHPTLEAGPVSTSDFARPHLPTEDPRAIDQAAVPVNRDHTRPKVHS